MQAQAIIIIPSMPKTNTPRQPESPVRAQNHGYIAQPSDSEGQNNQVYRVGFVLLEHFSMMAFTGAVDALVTANLLSQTARYQFDFYGYRGEEVKSDLNIDVLVSGEFESIDPARLDVLLVCGGLRTNLQVNPKLQQVLQQAARLKRRVGGIWNGSYILAQAGIMEGYECTIHPENHALMTEVFPRVKVSKKPYVIDRDRLSSAGATSTLGLMLTLIGQLSGEDLMRGVEGILNVDSVLGEAADGSLTMLPTDPTLPQPLRDSLLLMETHIDEPLSAVALAESVELSRRQIERLFQQHLNTSPAKYYLELRLNRAHQLLRQSNASVVNIAVACGFSSSAHFSHCFKDHFGMSPSLVRKQRNNS